MESGIYDVQGQSTEENADNAGTQTKARLLIIDDEPTIRRAIQRCLPCHDMTFAEGGQEALALLKAEPFDIVLCDLSLPDMEGTAVYEALRRHRPALARRMVVITGGACTSSAQHFLDSGRVTVLHKPFSPAQLRAVVAAQLAAPTGAQAALSA